MGKKCEVEVGVQMRTKYDTEEGRWVERSIMSNQVEPVGNLY